ncbi:MAG: rRNA maturation RNase YbeY [Metamycoplasmataceae bacterium]
MKSTLNIETIEGYKFKYQKEYNNILKYFCEEFELKEDIIVDLLVTNNEGIKAINKEYRMIDKATDILSFPADNFIDYTFMNERHMGEIIISYEKLISQAEEFGHSELREFCYMFAHGLVHLNGMDHKKNKSEEIEFNLHVDNIINKIKVNRW